VGAAEKGSLTSAKMVRNMTEFERFYGTRQSYSILWDSLETFFRVGGSKAYVARVAGSAAVTAFRTLADASAGISLRIEAKNAGLWGNALSAAVVAGSQTGEFVIVVTHSTLGEVDRSPSVVDQAAAVNWSINSDWVSVTIPAGASALDPAVASAATLSGGLDDNVGITDAQRQTALGLFPRSLGAGQVSMPGNTTGANRTAILAHARANNRQALLDGADSPSRSALVTEGNGLQGDEYGALFAPWIRVPGVAGGLPKTVPASAAAAGLMARSDGFNSPNIPAAGANGQVHYALDVSQPAWTDADRELLHLAGVNVFRVIDGNVTLYGYRTLARPSGDTSWLQLNNQRLRLKITAEAENVAESFLFDQIDGRGRKVAEFQGALTGLLLGYYTDGALYGEIPDEAFSVDTGTAVNTPTTLAQGQLRAVITLKMSPHAELVVIEIVKIAITEQF